MINSFSNRLGGTMNRKFLTWDDDDEESGDDSDDGEEEEETW